MMAHLVCGYPSVSTSIEIAKALLAGGAAAIEIQFPFSDPLADGPTIQRANSEALRNGCSLKHCFEATAAIRRHTAAPLYIMVYAALPYRYGIEAFVLRAAESGASGMIVPDLPFDCDEGLYRSCRRSGIEMVIVTTVDTDASRLRKIAEHPSRRVYVSLRSGITGRRSAIEEKQRAIFRQLRTAGKKTIAGFGIREQAQLRALRSIADMAVVGSYFTNIMHRYAADTEELTKRIEQAARELAQ